MNSNPPALSPRPPSLRPFIGLIAFALLLQSLLRLGLAVSLLFKSPEAQFGPLVHWRVLDQYAGWVGLLILAMVEEGVTRGRGLAITLSAAGLIGVALGFAVNVFGGDAGLRAPIEIGVGILLALTAATVCLRQIVRLARAAGLSHEGQGLNIEQMWRAVAIQWALLWVAAEVALRIRFWREGVEAEERARTLLFLLPVLGLLPNVIMAMGIRWWSAMRKADVPRARVRAWLVALVALNLGAVGMVASIWFPSLGIVGSTLLIVGIGMYLVGFPKGTWRTSGKVVPPAFGILVLGVAMIAVERIITAGGQLVPTFYSYAWRHLLASVEILWLIGIGGMALQTFCPQDVRHATRGVAMTGGLLVLLGILATASLFLFAINQHDLLQGLFVGAALHFLGVAATAAVALRASGAARA